MISPATGSMKRNIELLAFFLLFLDKPHEDYLVSLHCGGGDSRYHGWAGTLTSF